VHLPVTEMTAVAHVWRAVEDTDASATSSALMSAFSTSAVHIVIVITGWAKNGTICLYIL